MRTLYRELLSSDETTEEIKEALRNAEVFRIDNVAEYFYKHNNFDKMKNKEWNISKEFPNLAPPFDCFWMEFSFVNKWGYLFICNEVNNGKIKWIMKISCFGNFKHKLTYYLELDEFGQLVNDDGVCNVYIDKYQFGDYDELTHETKNKLARKRKEAYSLSKFKKLELLKRLDELEEKIDNSYKHLNESMAQYQKDALDNLPIIYPCLLAITFLHCKNVQVVPHKPDEEKHRRRNRHADNIKYKVLQIEPMKRILREEGHSEETGLKKSLHICRGHFKDFTQGKGLFGKFKGLYWWENQVRGRAENGIVLKSYAINTDSVEDDPSTLTRGAG